MSKSEYIQALKEFRDACKEDESVKVLDLAIKLATVEEALEEWWEHQDRKLSE